MRLLFSEQLYMSRVSFWGDSSGAVLVRKFPARKFFQQLARDERLKEGKALGHLIKKYYSGITSLGLPVAGNILVKSTRAGYPVYQMDYEGNDVHQALIQNPGLSKQIVNHLIFAIAGLLEQKRPWAYGIDLRINNFCFNGSDLKFVDLFPPLLRRSEGNYLVHYPNPADPMIVQDEVIRKFTPFGAIRRMRFSLLSIDPELTAIVENELSRVLTRSLAREIIDQLHELPDELIVRESNSVRKKQIFDLPEDEVDVFREVAARVLSANGNRQQILDRIFVLSSRYSPPDVKVPKDRSARIEEVKRLLISNL